MSKGASPYFAIFEKSLSAERNPSILVGGFEIDGLLFPFDPIQGDLLIARIEFILADVHLIQTQKIIGEPLLMLLESHQGKGYDHRDPEGEYRKAEFPEEENRPAAKEARERAGQKPIVDQADLVHRLA